MLKQLSVFVEIEIGSLGKVKEPLTVIHLDNMEKGTLALKANGIKVAEQED